MDSVTGSTDFHVPTYTAEVNEEGEEELERLKLEQLIDEDIVCKLDDGETQIKYVDDSDSSQSDDSDDESNSQLSDKNPGDSINSHSSDESEGPSILSSYNSLNGSSSRHQNNNNQHYDYDQKLPDLQHGKDYELLTRYDELQANYLQLQVMNKSICQQLEQIKRNEEEALKKNSALNLQLTLLTGEKERLISSLDESRILLSDIRHENDVLQDNLSAVQKQLSFVTNEKNEALLKIEECETNITALEKRVKDLQRSDTLARVRNYDDQIISDLKSRHQKEILKYKQIIEKLEVEIKEVYNKFSSQLETSQKQVQQLLATDTHLKIQQFEEENNRLIKQETIFKNKIEELEEMLQSLSSAETISLSLHEAKMKNLEKELEEKYYNVTEKLRKSAANEKNLQKFCEELQRNTKEMVEKHAEEKIKAIKECRDECLEIHKDNIEKWKRDADIELKGVCTTYENKIAQLEKELKFLNDGLYDSKAQYVDIFKENKVLLKKLDNISKPVEREEIQAEIHAEYEKKMSEMKEMLQQENAKILESCLKKEIVKIQEEWTKQKMEEVKKFVETTKKNLDEKFQDCLKKEQEALIQQLEEEKAKLHQSFIDKINLLKKENETEKLSLQAKLSQHFQTKLEEKVSSVKKQHEEEVKSTKQEYAEKIFMLETKIESLKIQIPQWNQNQDEIMQLKKDIFQKQEDWGKERQDFLHEITSLKLTIESSHEIEKSQREKIRKCKKHISELEKYYKQKNKRLQTEISDLQKQIILIKDECKQVLQRAGNIPEVYQNSVKNCESQTEEEMVPKQKILTLKSMFLSCLKNITEEKRSYLEEFKRRSIQELCQILVKVLSQTYPFISCNTNDQNSYNPNLIVPNTEVKRLVTTKTDDVFSQGDSVQNFCSSKLKTSTPYVPNILNHGINDKINGDKKTSDKAFPISGLFSNCNVPNSRSNYDGDFDTIPFKMQRSAFDSSKLPSDIDFAKVVNECLQTCFPANL